MNKKYTIFTEETEGIIQAGYPDAPYYTNSTQLPASYGEDVFAALDLQDDLQCSYNGGCVEKGNYVLTDRGPMLIEDIEETFTKDCGLKVVSFNPDTGCAEWDEVEAAMKIDVSKHDKIRVRAKGGLDITTSDWHPFFVLTPDGVVEERRADELHEGDWLICNKTNMFTDDASALDEDIAYLFGYFIGDGALTRYVDNRGDNCKVRFTDSDVEQLNRVVKILQKNGIQNEAPSDVLHELSSSDPKLVSIFADYGFTSGNKTYTISIPDKVKSALNKRNAFALLSGLMDSCGCIIKNGGDCEYLTASCQLAHDIVWLCGMLGVKTSFDAKHDKRYTNPQYIVSIGHREMGRICSVLTTSKTFKDLHEDKRHHGKLDEDYNLYLVTDVSKTDVEDNQFYDLTTKHNHNYLCGKESFVFIHNTVFHIYSEEDVTGNQVKEVIKKTLKNYRMPYVSYTASFSTCPKHGRIAGLHDYCPLCDQELLAKHYEELDK